MDVILSAKMEENVGEKTNASVKRVTKERTVLFVSNNYFLHKYLENDITDILKRFIDVCYMNVNRFEFIVLCFTNSGLSAQVQ